MASDQKKPKTPKTIKYVTLKQNKNSEPTTINKKKTKKTSSVVLDESDDSLRLSTINMIDTDIKFNSDDSEIEDVPNIESSPSLLVSADEVKEKLKNFEMINRDKIKDIAIGSFIRYVEVLNNGMFKIKLGGILKINNPAYLILMSNNKSWSVQLNKHIIFVENNSRVRKELELEIKKLRKRVSDLEASNVNLREKLDQYTQPKKNSIKVNKISKNA
jgi:hypothetical protein